MSARAKEFLTKTVLLLNLILVGCIISCTTQDEEIIEPVLETESNEEFIAAINSFTGGDSKTYKIESALLSNTDVTNLDITSLFNIKDDEFVFTTNSDGQLKMLWHEGFELNALGVDSVTVKSDTRTSSKIMPLTFNDGNVSFEALGFSFSEQNGLISGILTFNAGATLTVELQNKLTSDYLQPPTSLNTLEELFSITGGSVWSGFKGSISENNLYLTNLNWPIDTGNRRAFKFDLENNTLSSFDFSQFDFLWNNLEILNDNIYNVGGSFIQKFNTAFNQLESNEEISNLRWDCGSAAQDDYIYLFSGYNTSPNITEIGRFDTNDGSLEIIGTLPSKKSFADGEIVNNKIYLFGGFNEGFFDTYDNFIFDLETGNTETIISTVNFNFTSTSVVENLIYAGGMKSIDEDGDGEFDIFKPYLEVLNTLDNTTTEIAINFDMLDNERLYKIWAKEDFIYLVLSQNQTEGSANLRVVRSPLF